MSSVPTMLITRLDCLLKHSQFSILQKNLWCVQPVEFCSDVFLLPLGSPPQDYLDSEDTDSEMPPNPPPLDPAIYHMLLKSMEKNNNDQSNNLSDKSFNTVEHFV
jgi:hypothetical protein